MYSLLTQVVTKQVAPNNIVMVRQAYCKTWVVVQAKRDT